MLFIYECDLYEIYYYVLLGCCFIKDNVNLSIVK